MHVIEIVVFGLIQASTFRRQPEPALLVTIRVPALAGTTLFEDQLAPVEHDSMARIFTRQETMTGRNGRRMVICCAGPATPQKVRPSRLPGRTQLVHFVDGLSTQTAKRSTGTATRSFRRSGSQVRQCCQPVAPDRSYSNPVVPQSSGTQRCRQRSCQRRSNRPVRPTERP